MDSGFRVALGLVVKAQAEAVDLHRALHHRGPAHERALRRDPGAVALVTAQICQPRTHRLAPGDGTAVVADMADKQSLRHGRQQFADHRRVAAKTVA